MAGLLDLFGGMGAASGGGISGLFNDPTRMGLLNMGTQLLQASGPSPVRQSLGQIIGQGTQGFVQGAQQADMYGLSQMKRKQLERELKTAQRRDELLYGADPADGASSMGGAPQGGLIGSLPDDQRAIAAADPEGFVKARQDALFGKGQDPTNDMQNYALAQKQGYGGTFMDFKADLAKSMRAVTNINNIPAGYQPGPNGGLTYVPGGPADPDNPKNLSDTQRQAATYAARLEQANSDLSKLGEYVPSIAEDKIANTPVIGNTLATKEYQQYSQAQRNFINAQLRRESGAVISPSEFDNAEKQYFPKAGDSPEVKAQKAANRALAIEGMKQTAGVAYDKLSTTGLDVPPDAIKFLKMNPKTAEQFDAKYGSGSAAKYLRQR